MARVSVATDNFDRADGDIGANWAIQALSTGTESPGFIVTSNKANPNINEIRGVFWAGTGTFTQDQYFAVNLSLFGGFGETIRAGGLLRASGSKSTANGYHVYVGDDATFVRKLTVYKVVNGAGSSLVDKETVTFNSGDELSAEATGSNPTTINVYRNGTLIKSVVDSTSPITTGKPGMSGRSNTLRLDDWEGGNVTGGSGGAIATTPTSLSIAAGSSKTFDITRATGPLTNYNLSSSNVAVATVPATTSIGQGGTYVTVTVTAVGAGTATISIVDAADQLSTGSVEITVTSAPAVKGAKETLSAGASLAGLSVRWWDNVTQSGAPLYSTDAATTDASKVLKVTTGTALSIGAFGTLSVFKQGATPADDYYVTARVAVKDVS